MRAPTAVGTAEGATHGEADAALREARYCSADDVPADGSSSLSIPAIAWPLSPSKRLSAKLTNPVPIDAPPREQPPALDASDAPLDDARGEAFSSDGWALPCDLRRASTRTKSLNTA